MYQTAWVKVSLSPRVPLALSRHPLRSTSNLSLMHHGIFSSFGRRSFLRNSRSRENQSSLDRTIISARVGIYLRGAWLAILIARFVTISR